MAQKTLKSNVNGRNHNDLKNSKGSIKYTGGNEEKEQDKHMMDEKMFPEQIKIMKKYNITFKENLVEQKTHGQQTSGSTGKHGIATDDETRVERAQKWTGRGKLKQQKIDLFEGSTKKISHCWEKHIRHGGQD